MSSEYSVFMKGDKSVLLRASETVLGCAFGPPMPTLGNARHTEIFEVAITFQGSHCLENDMEIPFEDYPVSLEFARSASQSESELRADLCRVLALLCGRLIAARGHADTFVVRDLQELIEARTSS